MKTLVCLVIIIFSLVYYKSTNTFPMKSIANASPFPSYFISHGGPTFMYTKPGKTGSHGAYSTLQKLGKHIVNVQKPDYIIVVSAHWQSSQEDLIEISVPTTNTQENNLVYDFYNFPKYMYLEQFKSNTSLSIAQQIKDLLIENGFKSKLTPRGIDHGVWVPFKALFSKYTYNSGTPLQPGQLDIDIPIIQISLTSNETDFAKHFQLGQVLNYLRVNDIYNRQQDKYLKGIVITSGMSVHNLRDLGIALGSGSPQPYVEPFNELLTKTLTQSTQRLPALHLLLQSHSKLLYSAHPTLEHFVPIVISLGMVEDKKEPIVELYNAAETSVGWGIYQFGKDHKEQKLVV